MKFLFIIFQYIIPQHLLSRAVGSVAQCSWRWLKNPLIKWFIQHYRVNMSEALENNIENFENFNDFFTRELVSGARPIVEASNTIACPADGAISQLGTIELGRIFQAKGQSYSLLELVGGDEGIDTLFYDGNFATVYLSPKDYHRVHMPLTGKLMSMTYIPGDLFSVNNTTAENVPRLFVRNERAVCVFETDAGPMAVILIGAMIVAGIETVWAGQVAPIKNQISKQDYQNTRQDIILEKGSEMGRFKLGSTAILLFGADKVSWKQELSNASPTRMGEFFGTINPTIITPEHNNELTPDVNSG